MMKYLLNLTLLLALLLPATALADVTINSTNFPDANFRNYLLTLYPKGYLTQTEINNLTSLNVSEKQISNLKGLEYFTALTELRCYWNNLTTLDISNNTRLTNLLCHGNSGLKTIVGLANCTALEYLSCNWCALTDLSDVKNKPRLTNIICYSNALTKLDVTGNTALTQMACEDNPGLASITGLADCKSLEYLWCQKCGITDLSALSVLDNLSYLHCYGNKLTSLTLTNKTKITQLYCYDNPQLTALYIFNNYGPSTLDCHNCPALNYIYCYNNQILSTLDVTDNTALTYLSCENDPYLTSSIRGLATCKALKTLICNNCELTDLNAVSGLSNLELLNCHDNKLSSLTLTNMPNLKRIECYNNPIRQINVTGNPQLSFLDSKNCKSLTRLYCYDNALTSLTVTDNRAMKYLHCYNNKLTKLDLSGCNSLNFLDCYQNNISGTGMTTLVNSLPTLTATTSGTLRALYNTNEGNTMSEEQITAANKKYWIPMKYEGSEWVECTVALEGDVNIDGEVSIADVNVLIDVIISGTNDGALFNRADLNNDHEVTIADVNALIDLLLSHH